MKKSFSFSAAVSILLSSTVVAQVSTPAPPVNDDCAGAVVLSGTGGFAYDPGIATDSGFNGDGGCSLDSQEQDVFFTWIAPATGAFVFETDDSRSSYDTRISIYAGDCQTAACVGSDDDSGREGASRVTLNGVTSGSEYVIQIGAQSSSTTLTANMLWISPVPAGGFCFPLFEDAYENNDDCATAITLTQGVYSELYVTDADTDWFAIEVPAFHALNVDLYDPVGDIDFEVLADDCATHYATTEDGWSFDNPTASAVTVVFEAGHDSTSGSSCSVYELDLSFNPIPCLAANNDDMFEDNDDCASAVTMVDSAHSMLWVSDSDKDYYTFCVESDGTVFVDIMFMDAFGNIDLKLMDSTCSTILDFGGTTSDNELVVWANTTRVDTEVVLIVEFVGSGCNTYDMVIHGSGCTNYLGNMYCTAEPNSTGSTSRIFGTGDVFAANNNFSLLATDLPEGEFAYFIGSYHQTQVNNPGSSSGNLCVGGGGAIARFHYTLGAITGGQFTGDIDLTNVPLPPSMTGAISSGQTFNFQLWHREGGSPTGQSNFSPGLEVTFL